jgi:putative tryptophan/tyrosine transport system substrate-binding protein
LTFDPGTFQSRSARFEPFFNRLNELGYVDGQTITIDYLSAEGRNDRFADIAAECLRFKADVITVTTTPGALAAKQATQTIPIVTFQMPRSYVVIVLAAQNKGGPRRGGGNK